jgi:hypothetical protein
LLPAQSWCTLTLRAESAARTAPFARGRDTEPLKRKNPPGKAGLHDRPGPGISSHDIERFPESADFSKPFGVHRRSAPKISRFRAGCAATPEEALFSIIAIPFDAFQALPCAKSRWLLTCLARYTNRAGEAWPTMRQLAVDAAMSLASVSRHLKAMEGLGVFQRERLPGGGRYRYTLAEPYRLRWPSRDDQRVSRVGNRVSEAGKPRQVRPEKHDERGRFADKGFGEVIADDRAKWDARLLSWRKSRFWLPMWGPKPGEAGCFAPVQT